mmetsp:Transcript_48890/g.96427  ORF Transcript_48890/g.96427 Transcript_48890/m.96427 type:complete len:108 (-) Transcript_48890:182-505(-)
MNHSVETDAPLSFPVCRPLKGRLHQKRELPFHPTPSQGSIGACCSCASMGVPAHFGGQREESSRWMSFVPLFIPLAPGRMDGCMLLDAPEMKRSGSAVRYTNEGAQS